MSKEARAADAHAGPSRAPLAAPPRNGRATDGTGRLNLDQSSGAEARAGSVPRGHRGRDRHGQDGARPRAGPGRRRTTTSWSRWTPWPFTAISTSARPSRPPPSSSPRPGTSSTSSIRPRSSPSQPSKPRRAACLAASTPAATFRSSSGEPGCITGRSSTRSRSRPDSRRGGRARAPSGAARWPRGAVPAPLRARPGRRSRESSPRNRRRIVRALEVTLGSGRPFSSFGPGLVDLRRRPARSSSGSSSTAPSSIVRLAERFEDQLARGLPRRGPGPVDTPGRACRARLARRSATGSCSATSRRACRSSRQGRVGPPAAGLRPPSGGLVQARSARRLGPGRPRRPRRRGARPVSATRRGRRGRATLMSVLTLRQVPGPRERLPRRARRLARSTRRRMSERGCAPVGDRRTDRPERRARSSGRVRAGAVRPPHRRRSRRAAHAADRPGAAGDVRMELRNADGGRAETSGNGLRCFALAAIEAGLVGGPEVVDRDRRRRAPGRRFVTGTGPARPTSRSRWDASRVAPLGPRRRRGAARLDARCPGPRGSVDAGNPHLVVLAPVVGRRRDRRRSARRWSGGAPAARTWRSSPVSLAKGELSLVVWERGAGVTLACGSGSVAAAAALHSAGISPATKSLCTIRAGRPR